MRTPRAHVPLAASRWVAAAVRRVLERRPPGTLLDPLPCPHPSAAGTGDLIEAITRHRVIPLLTPWADQLGLPPDVVRQLQTLRRELHLRGLANMLATATVARTLKADRVDHLVVKGVCLPALTQRQPAARGDGGGACAGVHSRRPEWLPVCGGHRRVKLQRGGRADEAAALRLPAVGQFAVRHGICKLAQPWLYVAPDRDDS